MRDISLVYAMQFIYGVSTGLRQGRLNTEGMVERDNAFVN